MNGFGKLAYVCAVIFALLTFGDIAVAAPKDVGPKGTANPLPGWYRDNSTVPFPSGIPLQPCISQVPGTTGAEMCVLLADPHFNPLVPIIYSISADGLSLLPGFNFPSESFFFIADATYDFTATDPTAAVGSKLVVRAALEGAFLSDPPLPPTLSLFTRVRVSLDPPRAGTYVIQHPYGTSTLTAVPDPAKPGRFRPVVEVVDMPLAAVNPLATNPDTRSISTFLHWADLNDARLSVGGQKFIGDPNILAPVVGGPLRNSVVVTGAATATITNWAVAGQLFNFPPQLTFTAPASTDFGSVEMGLASAPKTFTIANTATAPSLPPLTVSGVALSSTDFQVKTSATNPCPAALPFNLAVGSSCNVDVIFSPPRGGAPSIPSPPGTPRTGTLTVTTNAATAPTATANLTGSALTPVLQLAVTPSKASPQVVSALTDPPNTITFTAAGSGPAVNGYEYQFSQRVGTVWTVVQPWAAPAVGTQPAWSWTTNGAAAGSYEIKVEMRETAVPPALPGLPVAAASALYNLVSFTFNATASPSAPAGTPAVVTATSNLPGLEYRFLLFRNNVWTQMQIGVAAGTTATWTWNTLGIVPGIYPVTVEVRRPGVAALVATKTLNYTVAGPLTPPVKVTLTPTLPSPRVVGTQIPFTAVATGGSGNMEYRYSISSDGGKTYTLARDWNAAPAWTWNTTGAGARTYMIKVDARTLGTTLIRSATAKYTLR